MRLYYLALAVVGFIYSVNTGGDKNKKNFRFNQQKINVFLVCMHLI